MEQAQRPVAVAMHCCRSEYIFTVLISETSLTAVTTSIVLAAMTGEHRDAHFQVIH